MKDEKIEKVFEEYFDGVITRESITADAKKHVGGKSPFISKFVKFASVAASFVLVLAATLVIVFNTRSAVPAIPAAPGFTTYGEDDLTYGQTDVYGVTELDPSLKFITDFAYGGAGGWQCSAGYLNGELAIVEADVSLIDGLSRHDTKIFAEFTDEKTVYSPLKDYYEGTEKTYRGVKYYLTRETAENGEPVNKLCFTYGTVKYYFFVSSSDNNAYMKYLKTVIG